MTQDFLFLSVGELLPGSGPAMVSADKYIIDNQLRDVVDYNYEEGTLSDFMTTEQLTGGDLILLEVLQQARSKLVLLSTKAGFLLLSSDDPNEFQVLYSSLPVEENIGSQTISSWGHLNYMIPGRPNLQKFDYTSLATLRNLADRRATVEDLVGSEWQYPYQPEPLRIIAIREAQQKFRESRIQSWRISPRFTAWAPPNHIAIYLQAVDGGHYLIFGVPDPVRGALGILNGIV